MRAEADRLHFPDPAYARAERDAQRRAELEAQRERLGWALADGLLEREQVSELAQAISTELELLAEREQVSPPPAVHWDEGLPSEINDELRSLWRYVELGPDLRPIRAEWRDPRL